MQDRYAGDIGDYGKIGLLKTLQAQGLFIGVNWCKAEILEAEKKSDGFFKQDAFVSMEQGIWGRLGVCRTLVKI